MSGPKGYSVRVESAEERLRRAMAAAEARCGVLGDRLAGLRAVAGASVPACEAPRRRTLAELQSWEERLQRAISDAEGVIDAQRSQARVAAMASTVGMESLRSVSLGQLRSAGSVHPSARGLTRQDAEAKVADLVGRAGEIDDQEVLDALAVTAKALLGLQGPELSRALAGLESDVAQAVKQYRIKRRCRAEAETEALRVAHLGGADADAIRVAARTVVDESGVSMVRAQVARAVADAECRADAAFVTAQARLALMDLGYVVDEPFETLEETDGFVARRSDLPDHGLQVQVSRSAGRMLTRVVAVEATSSAEDAAAEDMTCADVIAFTAAMSAHGVTAELGPHAEPGEVKVEHSLKGDRRSRQQTKKARRVAPKEMGLRP